MSCAFPEQSTVLVVDDEVPLRHYMARVMVDDGYRVLTAADGIEALALLKRGDARVDLVITDVLMPLMTGPELAAQLASMSCRRRYFSSPAGTAWGKYRVPCSRSHSCPPTFVRGFAP